MNVKVGDLAYVVHGKEMGSVVEVIREWGLWGDFGFIWTVEFKHDVRTCQSWDGTESNLRETGLVKRVLQCPDSWLRPISGVPVTDDVEDEVTA
ncbi:TPA: hypothetical protein QDA93_002371 [Burkholderia vietnamiensis]|nr:hypothetical protein [Burkholderia vietnamiensis]